MRLSHRPVCPQVYRGVRVGGQQEALKHSQNKGAPHFPHDFPDCPAGTRFQSEQEAQFCETYKRCVGVVTPAFRRLQPPNITAEVRL